MTNENETPTFTVQLNNAATNDPCAVCGKRTDPTVGPELFLSGTWALVCHACGERNDPILMRRLRVWQAIEVAYWAGELPFE